MPALFAYLVAVTLLLGGGYGALTWLAAPEPVKIAAKVKPKRVRHYETIPPISDPSETSTTTSSATNAPESDGSNESASGYARAKDVVSVTDDLAPSLPSTNDPPKSDTRAEVNEHVNKQINEQASGDGPAAIPDPVQDRNRAARAEAPVTETKRKISEGTQPSPSRPSPPESSGRPQSVASADSATGAKVVNRSRLSRADRHSERSAHAERRGLVRMTLRTIEFPDGSRETRLIPYRDGGRNLDD